MGLSAWRVDAALALVRRVREILGLPPIPAWQRPPERDPDAEIRERILRQVRGR